MIGCLWTRVHKQPIIALYFESETVLKLYKQEGSGVCVHVCVCVRVRVRVCVGASLQIILHLILFE